METGIVKWFDHKKGYGFIEDKEGDVFVHFSKIQMEGYKKLNEGDKVQYEKEHTNNGLQATLVIPTIQ